MSGYGERCPAVLDRMARETHDTCVGSRCRYNDPGSTTAAFLQRLPVGFDGAPRRATDGTVCSVVEGEGTTDAGNGA